MYLDLATVACADLVAELVLKPDLGGLAASQVDVVDLEPVFFTELYLIFKSAVRESTHSDGYEIKARVFDGYDLFFIISAAVDVRSDLNHFISLQF